MPAKNNGKQNVDGLTTDELLEQIEEDKKQVKKSSVFAFAALIALIALALAWFVMNARVNGKMTSVRAKSLPYCLATKKTETDDNTLAGLKELLENKFAAGKGTELQIGADTYYMSDGENIRLQVSPDNNLNNEAGNTMEGIAPGTSGKLTFYVIPREKGYHEFTFQMNFKAYKKSESTESDIQPIDNDGINNLINGHILFFRNYSEEQGYTDRIETGGTFKITRDAEFRPEEAIPVTIYWVWPEYLQSFRNGGELFQSASAMAAGFEQDMHNNPGNYFADFKSGEINPDWTFGSLTADQFTYLTECYNTADFQIGSNVDYLYLDFSCN